MRALLLPALLAALPCAGAAGQERPATTPTRDVDVLYRAMAGGKEVEQRSRFAVSLGRIRIDTPSPGLYVLVDRSERTMDMVSTGDRSVLEMPYDPQRTVGGLPSGQGFVRQGDDVVAGLKCTEWQPNASATSACMTADGVLLRVRSGSAVVVQAVRVAYGPIDPAVFAIPPGYQRRTARR